MTEPTRCPECGLMGANILPRYSKPTAKELKKFQEQGVPFTIKADENCQTCLKARLDFLDKAFGGK